MKKEYAMGLFNLEQEKKDAVAQTLRKVYGAPKVLDLSLKQFVELLNKIK